MNYDRIYEYRFKDVDQHKKQITWEVLSKFIYNQLGNPKRVLDPAAGICEFINNVPSEERWAIDINKIVQKHAKAGTNTIIGSNLEVELKDNYFDGVFVSHFLEHLSTQEEVAFFLERMFKALRPGGKIAIIGPNFKYCYKEYFDFADHKVLLSELGVAEHLFAAGFGKIKVHGKFLPLSFRGGLPVSKFLVRTYLNMPFAWKILGKQFLLVAEKEA